MKWNSSLYDQSHAFVSEFGGSLLALVPSGKAQTILDLGCGTGDLTQKLSEISDHVRGIDGSPDMIAAAKQKYPHLRFDVMDACEMTWENKFDTVFSNAVFHWIPHQKQLLMRVHRALKNGGALICEFGAHGNIARIEGAFKAAVPSYQTALYFPTTEAYSALLREAGFTIDAIEDFDRATPLSGRDGLRNWMKQFYADALSVFDPQQQERIFEQVENLLEAEMFDGKQWTADYRRIRVVASK